MYARKDTAVEALMEQLIAQGPGGMARSSRRCSISPCAWSGSASWAPASTSAMPNGAAMPTVTRARRSTLRLGR